MAQSIKLGSSTYVDATGVMLKSTKASRTNLEDWARDTVSATAQSNVTMSRLNSYRSGDIVTVGGNITVSATMNANANLVQLGVGAVALTDFVGMISGDLTLVQMYVTAGGMIRNVTAVPSGKTIIFNFSYLTSA